MGEFVHSEYRMLGVFLEREGALRHFAPVVEQRRYEQCPSDGTVFQEDFEYCPRCTKPCNYEETTQEGVTHFSEIPNFVQKKADGLTARILDFNTEAIDGVLLGIVLDSEGEELSSSARGDHTAGVLQYDDGNLAEHYATVERHLALLGLSSTDIGTYHVSRVEQEQEWDDGWQGHEHTHLV